MIERIDTISIYALGVLSNGLWIGICLALLCWAVTHVINKGVSINASTRYSIWFSVLVLTVGMMVWNSSPELSYLAEEPRESIASAEPFVVTPSEEKNVEAVDDVSAPLETPTPSAVEAPVNTNTNTIASRSSLRKASGLISIGPPSRVVQYTILALWLCIAGVLVIRLFASLVRVRRIKQQAVPASDHIQGFVTEWKTRLKLGRTIRVGISNAIPSAVAVGYTRPMILLPGQMLSNLDDDEIRQVILHELAHIRRMDDWTILAQQCIRAVLFFHPAVWILGRLMDRDREIACDDWVVSLMGTPKSYATCLAKMATLQLPSATPFFAAQATSGKHQLVIRVERILSKHRPASIRISPYVFAGIFSCTLAMIATVLYVSPVVAFTGPIPEPEPEPIEVAQPHSVGAPEKYTVAEPVPQQATQQEDSEQGEPEESTVPPVTIEPATPAKLQALGDPATLYNEKQIRLPAQPTEAGGGSDEPLSKASMMRWLKAVRTISSSGEQAILLVKVVPRLHKDTEVQLAFLEVVGSVPSTSERYRVLSAFVNEGGLSKETVTALLMMVKHMSSDASKANVLVSLLHSETQPFFKEGQMQVAFKDAMETLNHSGEYERVVKAFMDVTLDNR